MRGRYLILISVVSIVCYLFAQPLSAQRSGVPIKVNSEPSGAKLFVDGEYKGQTPQTVDLSFFSANEIELKKAGYEPAIFIFQKDSRRYQRTLDRDRVQYGGMENSYDTPESVTYRLLKAPIKVESSLPVKCDEVKVLIEIGQKAGAFYKQTRTGKDFVKSIIWTDDIAGNEVTWVNQINQVLEALGYDVSEYGKRVVYGAPQPSILLKAKLEKVEFEVIQSGNLLDALTTNGDCYTEMHVKFTIEHRKSGTEIYQTTKVAHVHEPNVTEFDTPLKKAFNRALHKFLADTMVIQHMQKPVTVLDELSPDGTAEAGTHADDNYILLEQPNPPAMQSKTDIYQYGKEAVVTIMANDKHGSGAVVSPDGFIVTNDHVVAGQTIVNVRFSNGLTIPGRVVRYGQSYDLALVKVEALSLKALLLTSSADLIPGTDLLAIGTPKRTELAQTITGGILSGRRTEQKNGNHYLQTDVAISPGNSGCPLLDTEGQIIGIVVSGYFQEGAENIAFAIPAEIVFSELKLRYRD